MIGHETMLSRGGYASSRLAVFAGYVYECAIWLWEYVPVGALRRKPASLGWRSAIEKWHGVPHGGMSEGLSIEARRLELSGSSLSVHKEGDLTVESRIARDQGFLPEDQARKSAISEFALTYFLVYSLLVAMLLMAVLVLGPAIATFSRTLRDLIP